MLGSSCGVFLSLFCRSGSLVEDRLAEGGGGEGEKVPAVVGGEGIDWEDGGLGWGVGEGEGWGCGMSSSGEGAITLWILAIVL